MKCTGKQGGCHSLQCPHFFFPCPPLVWEGRPQVSRVELPKAPCHARSQRTGNRTPALEGHDAKDEDEEPQHNVSRTREGALTLAPPTLEP